MDHDDLEPSSEGGGRDEEATQLGPRLDRLSELAINIQTELRRIKSEGSSSVDDVVDAEGVGGGSRQYANSNNATRGAQPREHHVMDGRAVTGISATGGALLSTSNDGSRLSQPTSNITSSNLVWLNVGGKKFCSTLSTLTKSPHSMLGAMFSGRFNLTTDEKNRYFIDRDGKHFGTILNFLRDGSIVVPIDPVARGELLVEAQYYQLSALIELLTPEERLQASHWRWSPGSKSAYITLVNDFRTARAGEGKNWNTVLGDTGYSSGRHYFEITITKYNNSGGGWGISFGLVDVLHDFEYNHFGHRDNLPKGTRRTWAYVAATGKIYERGVEMFAGRPYSVNDRVGLLLDWKNAIIRFFLNGDAEGPALPFSWCPDDGALFPSMSLNGGGDKFHVTILDSPKLPAPK